MSQDLDREVKGKFSAQDRIAPWILLVGLALQAGSLGISDDEAYYWVLAQRPALGYAFHPPAVAWLIGGFQKILGWAFGSHSVLLVRLPAVLAMGAVFALGLAWVDERLIGRARSSLIPWILGSFVGLFGLGWMMVPDIPLFLGWTVGFVTVWRICFERDSIRDRWLLGVASGLLVLSKYSGVLSVLSMVVCLGLWAPRNRRISALKWLGAGLLLGVTPVLLWNAQNEWASILYQIRDRHGGESISFVRWFKFWLVEAVFAGPVVIGFFWAGVKSCIFSRTAMPKWGRYVLVWVAPAACIFCVQPLFAAYKPHWAFIVWWPVLLGFAVFYGQTKTRWGRLQVAYGIAFTVLIAWTSHWPWMGAVIPNWVDARYQPTWDVTNDFYGWSELPTWMSSSLSPEDLALPVVGSRYQTASQAAFHLAGLSQVTLIPLEAKEKNEWPHLDVATGQGPLWPKLKRPVLFVTDNRYSESPHFDAASCAIVRHFDYKRREILAKWIEIWKCVPRSEQVTLQDRLNEWPLVSLF